MEGMQSGVALGVETMVWDMSMWMQVVNHDGA